MTSPARPDLDQLLAEYDAQAAQAAEAPTEE